MKPDWKDAPEWAEHLARDSDGEWRWFEFEPEPDDLIGYWRSRGGRVRLAGNDEFPLIKERRP